MSESPQPLPDDLAALKAIIAAQQQALDKLTGSNRAYEALVEALTIQLARLKKQKFGRSSETIARDIAQLKRLETVRPKKSCRRCEAMVQSPAPTRPVRRSMPGAGLLAHIVVSKYDDQQPLYRQAEILARLAAGYVFSPDRKGMHPQQHLAGFSGIL
jgi:transposase